MRRLRKKSVLALDFLVVGLVLVGLMGLTFGRPKGSPPVRATGTLNERASPMFGSKVGHSRDQTGPPGVRTAPRAPTRLVVPAAGVRSSIVRLGLNLDGTLEVPTDFSVAGWYALGPKPGQRGAAVIVGHLDSKTGPGVFYRLGEVALGNLIWVVSPNRAAIGFRVYAVREYAKTAFPTSLVYGQTAKPELRLITCGGAFDDETGHYLDNVVVFAREIPPRWGRGSAVAPGGVEPPHADSKLPRFPRS
jgi:Sortase domain